MDNGETQSGEAHSWNRKWLRILLPLGALLLGCLLLTAWVSAITPPVEEPAPALLSDGFDFDFWITKDNTPKPLTIGSNNKYIINVAGYVTSTASTPIIEDKLPEGITIIDINGTDWDCTNSTLTEANCFYTEAISPRPNRPVSLPPIYVDIKISQNG